MGKGNQGQAIARFQGVRLFENDLASGLPAALALHAGAVVEGNCYAFRRSGGWQYGYVALKERSGEGGSQEKDDQAS